MFIISPGNKRTLNFCEVEVFSDYSQPSASKCSCFCFFFSYYRRLAYAVEALIRDHLVNSNCEKVVVTRAKAMVAYEPGELS